MASEVSSTSNFPWAWTIEALSASGKFDTSLLIDIVKSAPEISDDLEKNVREMVTLRILERLSIEENQSENNDAPAQGQITESDPSNRAKDVLRSILDEMSATDPKVVGPEVLNWDVQSIIRQKKTSFPMSALQKLKKAVLEGGYSVLASLKERSGLTIRTQCDNNSSVNIGNSNCLAERLGQGSREVSENGDEESNLPDKNLVPASTNTAATSGDIWGKQSYKDQTKLDDVSTEKFKQVSNMNTDTAVQNSIGLASQCQSTDASEGIVQRTGRDRFHLLKEVKVGSSPSQNQDDRLEENFESVNLSPAKGNRAGATAGNLDRLTYGGKNTLDNGYDCFAEASKNIDLCADFIRQNRVENQITSPLYGQSDASEEILNCTEREAHNLQLDIKVGTSTHQNQDGEFQGTAPDRSLLPSKRKRVIVNAGKSGDGFDSHTEVTKKFRHDPDITGDNLVENPISSPIHGIMISSSEMIIDNTLTGKCNLEKCAPVGAIECDGSPHVSECQNTALKRLSQSSDPDDPLSSLLEIEANKVSEFSAWVNGQKMGADGGNGYCGYLKAKKLNNTSAVGLEKEIVTENATYGFEGNFHVNSSNGGEAKGDMVCGPDLEMTSDSDEYSDDRVDAAFKKYALLCSQCTHSQDSYATQSNSCIKCNGDGELLSCSSNTCQLVVHKSCLRSAGTFDENGKFYCPFCAYSRSISQYLQAKRKASSARRDLAMFIGVKTDGQPKKSRLASDGAKQGQLKRNDELGIGNEGNVHEELMNQARMYHCLDTFGNWSQAELPKSYSSHYPLQGKKMSLTDGTSQGSAKRNLEKLDVGQQLKSPGENLEQKRASELVKKSDNVHRTSNIIDRNEKNREMCGKKIQEIRKSTLPLEPQLGSKVGSSEDDNEKLATSRYSRRLRNPVKQYTDPAIPQLRRKALPWSKAEEEKLKEGVQRLSCTDEKKIPWSKILEFGADIFQKGRTAVDLKDKWRNMCRGS